MSDGKQPPVVIEDGEFATTFFDKFNYYPLMPVFRFNNANTKLILDPRDEHPPSAQALNAIKEPFASIVGDATGWLVITYEDGSSNVASAFGVFDDLLATAERNVKPSEKDQKVFQIFFTKSARVPDPRDIKSLMASKSETLDYGFREVVPVERHIKTKELVTDDYDPIYEIKREDPADFAFLTFKDSTQRTMYVEPFVGTFASGMHVASVGIVSKVFDKTGMMYFAPHHNFPGPDEDQVAKHFHRYGSKLACPGTIIDPVPAGQPPRLLAYSSSTLPSHSGALVAMLSNPPRFAGIHVGGWTLDYAAANYSELLADECSADPKHIPAKFLKDRKPNWNLFVPNCHPAFVCEYSIRLLQRAGRLASHSNVVLYLKWHAEFLFAQLPESLKPTLASVLGRS